MKNESKNSVLNREVVHNQLYKWYEQNKRVLPWRETSDPYKIWISEIILQQTRVEQGMPYYMRFIDHFPDLLSLANASEDEVLLYWQGLGYYSRARNLHKAALQIVESGQTTFPADFDAIRALPGIGDYTAGAIAAFAYNKPYPALDGNVYRVLSRLTDCEIAFDTSVGKKHFHKVAETLLDKENARLFNSAIMEFGALWCVPQNPDCAYCPLASVCLANAHHTVDLLPVRKPRPQLRDRYLQYDVYLCKPDGNEIQTLIQQRQGNDIWKHLWEFPLTERETDFTQSDVPHVDFTHILSHQRLHARFYIYKVSELPNLPNTKVVRLQDLDDFALSRLTLRALEKLGF